MNAPTQDVVMAACVDLIRRTGAHSFQVRYSDDEKPVVWMAVAEYTLDKNGHPAKKGERAWVATASLDPAQAAFELCEKMVDGAECKHCHRPSGVTLDFSPMPLAKEVCWYQYDPELQKFRRSCE